jgi:uncharacterized protein (TIGR02594 family)
MPDFRPDNSGLTLGERRLVQEALRRHGFDPGPVDGIIGPRTESAIVAFKRSRGLLARAFVGEVTWAALMSEAAPQTEPLPWLAEGRRVMGWHERADNAALRDWLRSDGRALGDPARFPWCGDFVETCIRLALPSEPFTGALKQNPYWALNWRGFGVSCEPCRGAVVSITRDGGGHVGFAVGQDPAHIYVMGGNQSNRVSVAPIARARFVAQSWRWPLTWGAAHRKPLPLMSGGTTEANFA